MPKRVTKINNFQEDVLFKTVLKMMGHAVA
jgi:hypothetical protein